MRSGVSHRIIHDMINYGECCSMKCLMFVYYTTTYVICHKTTGGAQIPQRWAVQLLLLLLRTMLAILKAMALKKKKGPPAYSHMGREEKSRKRQLVQDWTLYVDKVTLFRHI
jgi:hypothetical protein